MPHAPSPLFRIAVAGALALGALTALAPGDALASMSHRAGRTGFHGAIAYHPGTKSLGYAYDYRSARQAEVAALAQCGHAECEVLLHVRNACGVLMGEAGRTFTARGATHDESLLHGKRLCRTGACSEIAWVCTR